MSLHLEGLSVVKRGADGPRTIFQDVSFRVETGQRLAIVGPSGCGKTTLLRVVAGLDEGATGNVLVDGAPLDARRRGRISMAFQEPALLPWAGALDNVLLPVRLGGRPELSDVDRARRLLELVEIDREFWDTRPTALSGGMRQRVALAAALVTEPSLLLLDEPFASVDEITRFRLLRALDVILAARKPTCLLVTHSVTEALIFSDQILVLGGQPASITYDTLVDAPRPRTPAQVSELPLARISACTMQALGLG